MTRTIKTPALVLKSRPVGENHRGLSMLVKGEGLLHPFAYGAQGRRSSMRATAAPYNRGIAHLHYDGSKDRWRLTGFDAEETHDGLRENLDRFYLASVWAEILLNSHGGGVDSEALFQHSIQAFMRLSQSSGEVGRRLALAFYWGYLNLEGVSPNLQYCSKCGKILPCGRSDLPSYYYDDGSFIGGGCHHGAGYEVSEGVRKWLMSVEREGWDSAERIGLGLSVLRQAESWLLFMVQNFLERPLKSLRASPFPR
ncbi:MAG: DNA repair protein RecO [Spirochaetales bacterium]|nr:DNA repair protein RecO [Spirochaetales bacterium]